jgi:hypothetical protein
MRNGRMQAGSLLTQVFQRDVAAQAEANERHFGIPALRQGVLNHGVDVVSFAAVVRAQLAVRFAAAAPVVPRQRAPASPLQRLHHAQDVRPLRVSFQPV